MEKLWYNISRNVLEEMIKFVPRSRDEDCPKFLLKIEKVTAAKGRYILNVTDGTNLEILCLTSAGYSETFPIEKAVVGSLIRILHYLVFRTECYIDDENEQQFRYIIMISEAEIIKLPPAKRIVSITRLTLKTPTVLGIVDAYSGASVTHDGKSLLRFCLRDHTGSIRCSASGAMYAPLDILLKEGVKVQLSHATVTAVHPKPEMRDINLELKLDRSSVLKLYDPDNLNLLFSYSSQDIVNKLSDRQSGIKSSCTSFIPFVAISKLPAQFTSNYYIPNQTSSDRLNPSERSNSTLLDSRAKQTSFLQTPIPVPESSNPLSRLSLSQPSLGQTGSNQSINFNLNQQEFLPKQKISNAIIRSKSSEHESNQPYSSRKPHLPRRKTPPPPIPPTSLLRFIQRKCFDGKTPVPIASLTRPGVCSSWIRGMVDRHIQLSTIHTRIHLRDQSSYIRCTIMEPPSQELNKILKDNMILEMADFDVKPVPAMLINPEHTHELVLTKLGTIRAMTPDNITVVYSYRIRNSIFTQLGKKMMQKESPKSWKDLMSKYIDGVLSMHISSVQTEGICSSWIRGVVEYYGGLESNRAGRSYIQFFIRDVSAIIQCFVWQPICLSMSQVLKENMIIETRNYKVVPVKSWSKSMLHKFDLEVESYTTIRIFSENDTIVYEHLSS